MKTLKIRFVEHIGKSGSKFTMEYKGWFRWRRNIIELGAGYGTILYGDIIGNTKEECLNENLYHMNLCKDFIKIIEFSTVKTY